MSQKGRLLFVLSVLSFMAEAGLYFAIRSWMPFMWIVVGTGVICFFGWIFLDRRILADFFTMKATKQGFNMGALIGLAVIFLSAVNFFGARHYATFDFSDNHVNSISEQSKKILGSLESDLQVKYFYKAGADQAEQGKKMFRELVKHYQDISSKVKFEIVEINERPKLAADFGANKGSGEAFIEYQGAKNRIENYAEQDFTNAIIKATRKDKKNVYFLGGHGERSIDDEKSEVSLFGFRQMLEKNSFTVKKLDLTQSQKVPADAHVVVVAGPRHVFQQAEVKALEDYLNSGGSLLLMLDEKDTVGLAGLLKTMQLELRPTFIYNVFQSPMGKVVNAQATTVAAEYSTGSEITKLFTTNQRTMFRNPHSLRVLADSKTINTEVLVKTPTASVELEELDSKDYIGEEQSFVLGAHVRGKLNEAGKEFSAVVFSDADFVSNFLLYQNVNRDLALNAVSSLARETDLISISAKEPAASKMLVTPPEFSQFFKFTVVGLFLPLPFAFMILSLVMWYRRRHA